MENVPFHKTVAPFFQFCFTTHKSEAKKSHIQNYQQTFSPTLTRFTRLNTCPSIHPVAYNRVSPTKNTKAFNTTFMVRVTFLTTT